MKISFKNEYKIKIFPDKRKVRGFITIKPSGNSSGRKKMKPNKNVDFLEKNEEHYK